MTIHVDIDHRQGSFRLVARFETGAGLTSLFGPSGSGKTTLVNAIAGLIKPERGLISVDGDVWLDTSRGIFVPPHRRRLGYVFQEGRLFPHLTVRQNLSYGRWFAGARAGESLERVVDLLGIASLLDRRPGLLSGGEKQRVAIGRALMASPRILLMDEPLAALDAARKAEIMPYVERLRDESRLPIIYVSHSVEEVSRLATSIVVLSDGKVTATGPAREILSRSDTLDPDEEAEAGTLLEATVARHRPDQGLTELATPAGTIRTTLLASPPGKRLRVRIRARDVMIAVARPEQISALNILPGSVQSISENGSTAVDVVIACKDETITARLTRFSVSNLDLRPGRQVHAIIKSVTFDRHTLFDRDVQQLDPNETDTVE